MDKYSYGQIPGLVQLIGLKNDYAWEVYVESRLIVDRIEFRNFCETLYTKFFDNTKETNINYHPLLIRVEPFFTENLQLPHNSFLFDSSSWIRICGIDDNDNAYRLANTFFEQQTKNNIYNNPNAKENIEYNLRIQRENYLLPVSAGHGNFITPFIYSSETEKLQSILSINELEADCTIPIIYDKPQIAKYPDAGYNILLLDDKPEKGKLIQALLQDWSKNDYVRNESKEEKKKEIIKNLLSKYEELVNNKANAEENSSQINDKFTTWIEQNECIFNEPQDKINESILDKLNKLYAPIKEGRNDEAIMLMDCFIKRWQQNLDANSKTVWNEDSVELYYCSKDKNVSEHWYFKKLWIINERIKNKRFIKTEDDTIKGITRIFQVSNLLDMINLLRSNYFGENLINWSSLPAPEKENFKEIKQPIQYGLIMLDYLLGEKTNEKGREYSTEFFEWISNPKDENTYLFTKIQQENSGLIIPEVKIISFKYAEDIKENRGPLQKMWFYPITAFNNTFIDDLRNKGVRLIDYYWHISRGADPINTPYLFLSSLNNFLYLQLQQAVYSLDKILGFLEKSMQKIRSTDSSEKFETFDDFQAFMGSEYIVLMQKYGWRAVVKKDMDAGSAFSAYIWERFYSNKENQFLFRLLDKIQKLYHTCAYGDETDYEKMICFVDELEIFLKDKEKRLIKEYADNTNMPKNIEFPENLCCFREKVRLVYPENHKKRDYELF